MMARSLTLVDIWQPFRPLSHPAPLAPSPLDSSSGTPSGDPSSFTLEAITAYYLAGNAAAGPTQTAYILQDGAGSIRYSTKPCYPAGAITAGVYPGLTTASNGALKFQYNLQVGQGIARPAGGWRCKLQELLGAA